MSRIPDNAMISPKDLDYDESTIRKSQWFEINAKMIRLALD